MTEKFSGPQVRRFRCEERGHMNYRKNDRWPSYRFYSALQRQKSPMRYICEITQSVNSRHQAVNDRRPLFPQQRTCVERATPTRLTMSISSRRAGTPPRQTEVDPGSPALT